MAQLTNEQWSAMTQAQRDHILRNLVSLDLVAHNTDKAFFVESALLQPCVVGHDPCDDWGAALTEL